MAAYLVLADNETRAIIRTRDDERTGTYFRQKALLTFNTESYSSRDWSIELKSGKKLYFHQNDLGIMDEHGVSLVSSHTASTASGWLVFLAYNPVSDRYILIAHTREVYDGRSGNLSGGAFIDNISYYQGSLTTTKDWNTWIGTWQSQSVYPNYIKYFSGINFDSTTGDCEVHWWNNDLTQSAPFGIIYGIEGVPSHLAVNITNYLSPEDLSDTPFVGYSVSTNLVGCTADSENPSSIPSTATSTQFRFIPDSGRYFDLQSVYITGADYSSENPAPYNWNYNTGVLTVYQITCNITINVGAYTTPYSGGGESEPGYGDGTFDFESTDIPYTPPPSLGPLNSGFITLYAPNLAQLQNLASYLWSDTFDLDSLKRLFVDPMDVILGLSIIPCTEDELEVYGSSIYVGNVNSGLSCNVVGTQYVEVDCGTVNILPKWGAYLDYSPYTKLQLYLPYIGFVEISPDDCMNGSIGVKYTIDVYSGTCLAQVYCVGASTQNTDEGHLLYLFSGNCATFMPVTSGQYQSFFVSLYNFANGVGTNLGNIASAVDSYDPKKGISVNDIRSLMKGAYTLAENTVRDVQSMIKPLVQRSGGPGQAAGLMSPQFPFLILTTPKMIIPGNQNKMIGYPSYVTCSLGSLNGFTSVDSIHPEGIDATDEEITEIVSLLKNGVFL